MVAMGVMLLMLAAIPSIAAEESGGVCLETDTHHCETKHLYLLQTKTELFQGDTHAQPAHVHLLAATAGAQPPTAVADAALNSNVWVAAMLVMLSLSLGILIWTQRGRFENGSTKEKVATSCVLLYMVVTVSVDVLIRKFHQQSVNTAFQFNPAVITFFIELAKLIVMIVGACVDWKNTRECSLDEFVKTMRLMLIPAACFATMNIFRYVALSGADLDQYRVWRSTDIIFVACIWFTVFKKTPGVKQIAGIGLVCLSCFMMAMPSHDKKHTGEASPLAIITIVATALLSSLGLVMNEFGLKASDQMSLFVQNIALYLLTTVLNSALVLATVPMGQIFQGINSPQMGLIGLDVVLGVCVACVLKYADAITKQLASGWLAPLEPLVGHFLVGTPVTPMMVCATMVAGAGTIVYRLPEGKQEEKNEDVQSATEQSATKQ